jgi:hypothetical protein
MPMTYGLMRQDVVIFAAKGSSLALTGAIIYLKVRNEHRS